MNFPPAPLSTSAGVSTVFPLWSRMVMGINNVFRLTRPNVTECISRQGETDVDPVLLFENPSLQHLPKTSLFCLCPIQLVLESPVRSGFSAQNGFNRNRNRLN